jgi:hypothetical protein
VFSTVPIGSDMLGHVLDPRGLNIVPSFRSILPLTFALTLKARDARTCPCLGPW